MLDGGARLDVEDSEGATALALAALLLRKRPELEEAYLIEAMLKQAAAAEAEAGGRGAAAGGKRGGGGPTSRQQGGGSGGEGEGEL